MVLFIIFCPILAAVLIMLGATARKTALAASVLTFAAALFLFASLDHGHAGRTLAVTRRIRERHHKARVRQATRHGMGVEVDLLALHDAVVAKLSPLFS